MDVAASTNAGEPLPEAKLINNPTPMTLNLVSLTNLWRFNDSDNPGREWQKPTFDDGNWTQANSPFVAGGLFRRPPATPIHPAAKSTSLAVGKRTYYFRTQFSVPTNVPGLSVFAEIRSIVADALVVYVNGTEVLRLGMPSGPVTQATRAERSVTKAIYEGPFELPDGLSLDGTNVLAAEVHQANEASTNLAFAMTLDADFTIANPLLSGSNAPATKFEGDSPHAEPSSWICPIPSCHCITTPPSWMPVSLRMAGILSRLMRME
jgi:hypothetical protein